jgi:hypothetical protein
VLREVDHVEAMGDEEGESAGGGAEGEGEPVDAAGDGRIVRAGKRKGPRVSPRAF